MRAGPSTTDRVVTTLASGTCVDLLRLQGSWYEVLLGDARRGWCSAAYIQAVAVCPEAPSPAPVSAARQVEVAVVAEPAPAPAAAPPAVPSLPSYVGQPFVPNSALARGSYLHECFGQGDQGLRWADVGTPIQILDVGSFVPPAEQVDELGLGPFLKIRIWDSQYAWLPAAAVELDVAIWTQVPGTCEVYDTIDWAAVVRPTPAPQWTPTIVSAPSGGQSSCCQVCIMGKGVWKWLYLAQQDLPQRTGLCL